MENISQIDTNDHQKKKKEWQQPALNHFDIRATSSDGGSGPDEDTETTD